MSKLGVSQLKDRVKKHWIKLCLLACFIVLLLVGAGFICYLIPSVRSSIKKIEYALDSECQLFQRTLEFEIEKKAKLLQPISLSAANLARKVNSDLNANNVTLPNIETQVAPILFSAVFTVPYLSQISFVGVNGAFFSYFTLQNQTVAAKSESWFSSNSTVLTSFSVNNDTGNVSENLPNTRIMVNTTWFPEVFRTHNHATLSKGWNLNGDLLLFQNAKISGKGILSLGFSVKELMKYFTNVGCNGGRCLFLSSKDGEVLLPGFPNTQMVLNNNSISFKIMNGAGVVTNQVGNILCQPYNDSSKSSRIEFQGRKYDVYCSQLDIIGLHTVYALFFPHKNFIKLAIDLSKRAIWLFSAELGVIIVIAIFCSITLWQARTQKKYHAARLEMKNMIEQAERKSMNKSIIFARASHDIRNSLAGITALIEMCLNEAVPTSELETNLKLMIDFARDLSCMLNSILDASKIQAGKMKLEEEEFDLAELLKDVADFYHIQALEKGLEVVLDSCDGSVEIYSQVKGDRRKLKQILCNLLGNAVKFTSTGHITLRAWVRKNCCRKRTISTQQNTFIKYLCNFYKKNGRKSEDDIDDTNSCKLNPDSVEFVFEVDDSGIGIPKEMQQSVFENYIQVGGNTVEQEGTGLGLGIVQSLVRLMHGEIKIVDKSADQKGTCFRFNALFVKASETIQCENPNADIELGNQSSHSSLSPASNVSSRSPKLFAPTSQVLLLIPNEGRQRIVQQFMERLKIKVVIVKQWQDLGGVLKRFSPKSTPSSEMSPDSSSLPEFQNPISGKRAKEKNPNAMDLANHALSFLGRGNVKGLPGIKLLLIDINAGPLHYLAASVSEYRRSLRSTTTCRVIWLGKPLTGSIEFDEPVIQELDPDDLITTKPLHGSRLLEAIGLLPEFQGMRAIRDLRHVKTVIQERNNSSKPISSKRRVHFSDETVSSSSHPISSRSNGYESVSSTDIQPAILEETDAPSEGLHLPQVEAQQEASIHNSYSISSIRSSVNDLVSSTEIQPSMLIETDASSEGLQLTQVEAQQEASIQSSNKKPLNGKRVLVVDDSEVQRWVTNSRLMKLGADVQQCANGEAALKLVKERLSAQKGIPYDFILMDCMMPVMDGYEATRQIREAEKSYGVHIPIFTFSASHAENDATKAAGMDGRLSKPLNVKELLEAVLKAPNEFYASP